MKTKLNLSEIKVISFVTEQHENLTKTIKGGARPLTAACDENTDKRTRCKEFSYRQEKCTDGCN